MRLLALSVSLALPSSPSLSSPRAFGPCWRARFDPWRALLGFLFLFRSEFVVVVAVVPSAFSVSPATVSASAVESSRAATLCLSGAGSDDAHTGTGSGTLAKNASGSSQFIAISLPLYLVTLVVLLQVCEVMQCGSPPDLDHTHRSHAHYFRLHAAFFITHSRGWNKRCSGRTNTKFQSCVRTDIWLC